MSERIYFVSSDYQWAEEPTLTLCYWENGVIHEVSTNVDHGLGGGWITRLPNGRIGVAGVRKGRYVSPANFGSYWDDDGYQAFVDGDRDVVAYSLKDLRNPEVLLRDVLAPSASPWGSTGEGWGPEEIGNVANFNYFNSSPLRVFEYEGDTVVVGWRFEPSTESDISRGHLIHRIDPDGNVTRAFPHLGEGGAALPPPDGYTRDIETRPEMILLDQERGIIYMTADVGWGIHRYNLNTGERGYAPGVFPSETTYSLTEYDPRDANGLTAEQMMEQGLILCDISAAGDYWSWCTIETYDWLRSRNLRGLDVAPDGTLVALLYDFYPRYGEYAINHAPLTSPGGYGGEDSGYSILRINPDDLYWITDYHDPFPYDGTDGDGNPTSSLQQRFSKSGQHGTWGQQQADMGDPVPITRGRTLTFDHGKPYAAAIEAKFYGGMALSLDGATAYLSSVNDLPSPAYCVYALDLTTFKGGKVFDDTRTTLDPYYLPGGDYYDPNNPYFNNVEIVQLLAGPGGDDFLVGWWDGTTIRQAEDGDAVRLPPAYLR